MAVDLWRSGGVLEVCVIRKDSCGTAGWGAVIGLLSRWLWLGRALLEERGGGGR